MISAQIVKIIRKLRYHGRDLLIEFLGLFLVFHTFMSKLSCRLSIKMQGKLTLAYKYNNWETSTEGLIGVLRSEAVRGVH